jgi:hypothetical protein
MNIRCHVECYAIATSPPVRRQIPCSYSHTGVYCTSKEPHIFYKIRETASLVARKEVYSAISDVLIPVLLKIQVFCDVTLYRWVKIFPDVSKDCSAFI